MDAKSGMPATAGLRDRKKSRRREEILRSARRFFAEKGFDATTMAEIAESVEVSPPTVFNYFGSKDGLLIALISEGAEEARARHLALELPAGADFAEIVTAIFVDLADLTLQIAGKRVWRYAEAATIRRPATELARRYVRVDEELIAMVAARIGTFELRLRSGAPADPALLAQVFYDVWNAAFFLLIRDEDRSLDEHRRDVEARLRPLCEMLFEDAFLRTPTPIPARSPDTETP